MNFRLVAVSAAALTCAIAFAQAPTTTPSGSAAANTDYGITFNIGLSQIMTSGSTALSLGPTQQFTDSTGCNVGYRVDGPITCFLSSSCPADASSLPFCVLSFSGPSGLTLADVAVLSPIPSASPGATALRELPRTGAGSRSGPQVIYESLKKHRH